uniref:BTB domain-containing protein n=1 Tax=Steinernema glaseri TaxID=37863 RepID=A0A1I7ZAZ4_9BILA
MVVTDLQNLVRYRPTIAEQSGPFSKYVVFVSSDGQSFTLRRESAELSLKFWELLNSGSSSNRYNTYYLPDLNGEMLELAAMYLTHESHYMEEDFEPYEAPKGKEKFLEDIRNIITA